MAASSMITTRRILLGLGGGIRWAKRGESAARRHWTSPDIPGKRSQPGSDGSRPGTKKESRAKALLQCARKVPVISRLFLYGVAAIFRAAGFPPTDLDRNLRSARLLR